MKSKIERVLLTRLCNLLIPALSLLILLTSTDAFGKGRKIISKRNSLSSKAASKSQEEKIRINTLSVSSGRRLAPIAASGRKSVPPLTIKTLVIPALEYANRLPPSSPVVQSIKKILKDLRKNQSLNPSNKQLSKSQVSLLVESILIAKATGGVNTTSRLEGLVQVLIERGFTSKEIQGLTLDLTNGFTVEQIKRSSLARTQAALEYLRELPSSIFVQNLKAILEKNPKHPDTSELKLSQAHFRLFLDSVLIAKVALRSANPVARLEGIRSILLKKGFSPDQIKSLFREICFI